MKKVLTVLMLCAAIPTYAMAENTMNTISNNIHASMDSTMRPGKTSPNAQAEASQSVAVESLSRENIMDIQQALQTEGTYNGRVDGIWGRHTTSALMKFQRNNDLPANGALTTGTLSELGVQISSTQNFNSTLDSDVTVDESVTYDSDTSVDVDKNVPNSSGSTPFNASPAENTDLPDNSLSH